MQIHHIDDDHSNSAYENLAVVCLDCHTETQIRGGFHRKLDSDQVILYRDDWRANVSRRRAQVRAIEATREGQSDIGSLVAHIEKLKEQQDYQELIFTFHGLGQYDLRDKYVELLIKKDKTFETQLYFRGLQGRIDLLDQKKLKEHMEALRAAENWQDLSSAYFFVGDKLSGTKYLTKKIACAIEDGNYFNAAFCLRSLSLQVSSAEIFEKSLEDSRQKKDLFWELRALEELEWTDELRQVLKVNEQAIKENPLIYDMFGMPLSE